MAVYTIHLSVTPDGVTPDTPQFAGRLGDDRAAELCIRVPFTGCRYRLEVIDGAGGYDITDLLDAEDGTVRYAVPCAWTTAGIAALRVIAVGADGWRFHSAAAYLRFEDREDGDYLNDTVRPAWQETLDEASVLLDTLERKLINGEFKGEKGDRGPLPVKGVDYGTAEDKAELVAAVMAALPNGDEVTY